MDQSRGASVEDVGQEESKRGLYRKIARPLVSENKSTRIKSDPLQEAEGEEMSATSHGRRSWKDNPKAKKIAATVSSLLIAALIAVLVLALLKAKGK
jgi:hypothetical protein